MDCSLKTQTILTLRIAIPIAKASECNSNSNMFESHLKISVQSGHKCNIKQNQTAQPTQLAAKTQGAANELMALKGDEGEFTRRLFGCDSVSVRPNTMKPIQKPSEYNLLRPIKARAQESGPHRSYPFPKRCHLALHGREGDRGPDFPP